MASSRVTVKDAHRLIQQQKGQGYHDWELRASGQGARGLASRVVGGGSGPWTRAQDGSSEIPRVRKEGEQSRAETRTQ